MRRLIILTALAFAAIPVAGASAEFVSVNEAIFLATVDSKDHFQFLTGSPGNDQLYVPECFNAAWTRIPNKGGCYRRLASDLVTVRIARSFYRTSDYPVASFYFRVQRVNGCLTNTSVYGEIAYYYTRGGPAQLHSWYRQYC